MDDGSKAESGGLILSTDGFDKSSIDLLCSVLSHKFRLKVTTHKQKSCVNKKGDTRYRIYISTYSMVKLRSIVGPYIIPLILYQRIFFIKKKF